MAGFAEFQQRRLERLRLGQATCEIAPLLSDPETRIALVPLTEGEYSISLAEADKCLAGDNPAGLSLRDETQRQLVIFYAARQLGDLTIKFFDDPREVGELEAHDVNHLYDIYLEMVALNSPSMMGMTEEDFLALSVALPKIKWSELSGPQWYAAQRFLNSIRPHLLTASFSGSPSTVKSTPTNDEPISAESAA
jgi:hypothetical protein